MRIERIHTKHDDTSVDYNGMLGGKTITYQQSPYIHELFRVGAQNSFIPHPHSTKKKRKKKKHALNVYIQKETNMFTVATCTSIAPNY